MTSDWTRLATSRQSAREDPPAEAALDRLIRLAMRALRTPAATVSLLDGDQLLLFSQGGMSESWQRRRTVPLAGTLCQYPIQEAAPVTIDDVREDPRVTDELCTMLEGLKAYAGTPLHLPDGTTAGVLSVWSHEPRDWSENDIDLLRDVAASIVTEIELRFEISRRTRADAELEVQKTYFERLFESAPEAIIVVDKNDRIVDVNGEFTRMFGYSPEEAIGKATNDLIAPDELRDEVHSITQRVARGESVTVETERRRKDGSRLHVSLLCRPVRIGGEADAAYGIYRDITEHKRTETGLRFLAEAGRVLASSLDYRETLRTLVRLAVPDIADLCYVNMLDENGELWRVETMHSDPTKRAIATEIARRFPPTLDSANTSGIALREGRATLLQRIPTSHLERIAVDADHFSLLHSLGMRSGMTVPLGARGRVHGTLSFLITESEQELDAVDLALANELARVAGLAIDNARLYEAALEAGRAKTNFLSIISHELHSPLTTVIGYSDLLMNGIPEPLPQTVQSYIQRIRDSAWHQAALVEQILSFSRLEGEREELATERVDARKILRERTTLFAARASEQGLEIEIQTPESPVWIVTDPAKLTQILLNLLSNAVKFTETGGVRLELEQTEEDVVFHVEDTGIGIANEHLDRVFTSFWQVEDPATRHAGGTGLGLAVVHRLTQLLGGEIELDSQLGQGTTVTVRLPKTRSG